MDVEIVNETSQRLPRTQLQRVARRAARTFGLPPRTRVQLVFLSDVRMRQLNRRTRREDRATDVLAFPLHAWSRRPTAARRRHALVLRAQDPDGVVRLGDIVVAVETAARQSKDHRRTVAEEITMLVAHGLLHLLGYDHGSARDEERMTALMRRVIATD